jgi:hypothetical protein
MAVPMWIVAGAVSLVGHSLFPDQTDFRVLMAEPLPRFSIFACKVVSLTIFVGLFVAASHLALLPLVVLTVAGAARTGPVATAAAFAFSSVSGSLFAALAVVAVHGTLVMLAPPTRLLALSGMVRSVLIGTLVLSLPLVARLPGTAVAFASGAWWLRWAPPAWFVGFERWLIGDASRLSLAAQAGTATVLVLAVSVATYALLYRRFDWVVLQPAASDAARGWSRSLDCWVGRVPVRHAIGRFVAITIRRSVLHQGLVVGILAAGGGVVLNSLLDAVAWNEPLHWHGRSPLISTLLWAPMTMMFLVIPAIRLALSVPLDLRSNWIFRMTEDVPARAEIAAASVAIVLALGVALPLALLGPVQWWVLGRSFPGVMVIEALTGWLLVEWLMADWRRIPFTCSYVPGKGFIPHMFVKGVASYVVFTSMTTLILRFSLARPRVGVPVALAIGAAARALSVHRTRTARSTPLTFEDELPADVNVLRLNAD